MRVRFSAFRALLLATTGLIPICAQAQTPAVVAGGPAQAVGGVAPGEPVTREYERYAQNDLPPLSGAGPSSGYAPFPAQAGAPAANPFGAVALPPPSTPPAPAPQLSAQAGTGVSFGSNPFGATSVPTPDEPSAPTLSSPRAGAAPGPVDPLTADIDRSIDQISATVVPHLDGTLSLRGRSGDAGLGELFDVEAPIEASFSPNGYGRLKVQVNPVYLYTGRQSLASRALFGTNPLNVGTTGPASRTRDAGGAGLDVSYAYDIVSADIGSTPLGFQQSNIIGGLQVAPKLTDNITLRIIGERRAVTDSLLSYAGQEDTRTGEKFGGVIRNRGYAQFEGNVGTVNYYAGAGGSLLLGEQVKSNTEIEAGAGFSLPVWTTPTQEVRVGTSLIYLAYKRNLDNFTVGNGGYFSPQQYFAALFPVTYRQQLTPDLTYLVGGSIGVQTFRTKSEPIFPSDPVLQSQLVALAATQTGTLTQFGGGSVTGPAGGARAEVDYRVNDNLHVGAQAGFDRAGNFTEGTGLVYARYVFNEPSH